LVKPQNKDGFIWPVRIYYEDTDAGGVVYYANYLRFMERARTEWLRSMGFEQDDLRRQGYLFAVKRVQIDYLFPARFNQLLDIHSNLTRLGRASLTFLQEVFRGDRRLASATVDLVCVDADRFRPTAFPPVLARQLKPLLNKE